MGTWERVMGTVCTIVVGWDVSEETVTFVTGTCAKGGGCDGFVSRMVTVFTRSCFGSCLTVGGCFFCGTGYNETVSKMHSSTPLYINDPKKQLTFGVSTSSS